MTSTGVDQRRIRRWVLRLFSGLALFVASWAALSGLTAVVAAASVTAVSRQQAEIVAPDGVTPLRSGNASTPFTVRLPSGARCAEDSEHKQNYVDTYVVPVSTDPGRVYFPGGNPIPGTDLVTTGGEPYTGVANEANTATVLPPPVFSWAAYADDPGSLPPGAYNVGFTCVDRASHPTVYWNTVVTFTDDQGKFAWHVPGVAATASSSTPIGPIVGSVAAVVVVVAAAGLAVRNRRRKVVAAASTR